MPIAVEEVPESGLHIELVAEADTREAIAETAGVSALYRLEAGFDLARHGRDGLRVVGRVSATVGQNCVVTLEPLRNEIDEAVDLVFTPHAQPEEAETDGAVSLEADEPPEALRNGVVDLGAVATEFLILGIDPYPRKPGAVFAAPPAGADEGAHPFAALAALKKGQSSGSR